MIKEAKQTCDFVTVFPHWGTEYSEQPNAVQRELAKQCMDAGADLVGEVLVAENHVITEHWTVDARR